MDSSKILKSIHQDLKNTKENNILLLEKIQDAFGYVPEEAVDWFAAKLGIPASRLFGIITFYPKFRLRPVGRNTLTVCCGAACHIKGSNAILEQVRETLALKGDEDTSQNLLFTVEKATCIGACSIAPVVIVNKQVYGNTDPEQVSKLVKGFEKDDEYIGFI
ncbi:MAG: NADH-quinone oxidoreductase subunit NuoE [Thermodesulfovibrionales bacterium]